MANDNICPFFSKDEDACDVGCGYISPHDVRMMVAYCNNRFNECMKYRELAERFPEIAAASPAPSPTPEPVHEPAIAASVASTAPPVVKPFKARWSLTHRLHCLSTQNGLHSTSTRKEEKPMSKLAISRGWTVVIAGTCINLALGILYAYSMLKADIGKLFDGAGDPYAVACLSFAVSMIIGGKLQDKIGPRITAMIGGLFVGAGFILCSQTTNYWGWIVGFGLLAGLGFGFGYSAATPPALKWFPPAKTGLIAGIVVAGFGIAPVYLAPVCKYLLGAYGLQSTMMILGIAFIAIVCGMALFVSNPPAGFVVEGAGSAAAKKSAVADKGPREVLQDGRFYTLWMTFFIGAGAGLMVIGSMAGMAKQSMGEYAFVAVAVMAIGNAGGRVVAGIVSDKIGRGATLTIMLLFQAILMFAAIPVVGSSTASPIVVTLLATFIGFNYGSNLSLFPSFAKDFWGAKNYGMNYGLLFSSWGIGAFVLVKISSALNVKFGSATISFVSAGVLLLIGAVFSLSLRAKKVAVEEKVLVAIEEDELAYDKISN